jgi:hypothetical protein
LFIVFHSGLEGSAAPAVNGDDLDVTEKQQTAETSRPESGSQSIESAHELKGQKSPEAGGLSMLQKFLFIGLIVAVCIVFVRTKRDHPSAAALREKSLA